ncbi:MAG: class I SAM-dependent methyltransferase [Acutalibacteraceae bacterium]|nr:class I SAM-dependent methyltransferase [Acutalibacteraceae bacterium]
MKLDFIDKGKEFDFGRVSNEYAAYRNIYPKSMYDKLISFGIGKKGQSILDLGSGTAVLPLNLAYTGAVFTASDISENQLLAGSRIAKDKNLDNIDFKVCSAENTGFPDNSFDAVTAVQCFHYFNADKATDEIFRILKPNGLFCKILMDWLPFEDEVIGELEQIVLRYNPNWGGGGFEKFRYKYPDWAEGKFDINTIHSYNEYLEFTKEAWLGRVITCRGVGASLTKQQTDEFVKEYSCMLDKYSAPLHLKHQIHIEIYCVNK